MDYNTDSARESLTRSDVFGDPLKNDVNFKLLSPFSFQYNCIAFAMGMTDRWVDHSNIPWHWWPPVEKGSSVEHLKNAFQYFGFEECGMNDEIDDLYDKVALYHIANQWTHAARVVAAGVYHSKFGESFDGRHSSGNVLQAQYGNVCIIMRRLKTDSRLTDDRKGIAPGEMHLNIPVKVGGVHNHIVTYKGKTYLAHNGREVKIDFNKMSIVFA